MERIQVDGSEQKSSRERDEPLPLIEPDMQISSIRLTDTRRHQGPHKELTERRHR